jgi:phage terminase large subunit-like protein
MLPDCAPIWTDASKPLWRRVVAFCESLPVTSGPLAGQLWRCQPWQRKFIRDVFKTDRRGKRLTKTAVLSVGRKSGKTDLAVRLTLAFMVGPCSEPRGECVSAAQDRAQASRIFSEMAAIVRAVPWMEARINIRRHDKFMEDIGEGGNGSTYSAISSDVAVAFGKSISFFVFDEYGQSTNSNLYDALDTAMAGRENGMGMVISTQAARDDMPLSQLIDYGLRCERGEIGDKTFHLTLFSAPMDADITSPATWKLANPAIGTFQSKDEIARMAAQAERMPSKENSFRNLILNQRVDSVAHFLSPAIWNGCAAPVDLDSLAGRPCYAALDLSGSRDMTALVLAFTDDDGAADLLPFAWLPGEDLRDREDADRAPYVQWAKDGHLLTTPGKTIDPKAIAIKIAELNGRYKIRGLAFDRWRIEDLRRELDAIGCPVELVEFGQGFKDMSPAVDEFERLCFECKLRHGAHPVLAYCVSNTKIEADASGNRKPSKAKSMGRIDLAVAAIMATAAITKAPPPKPASVYTKRGILVF